MLGPGPLRYGWVAEFVLFGDGGLSGDELVGAANALFIVVTDVEVMMIGKLGLVFNDGFTLLALDSVLTLFEVHYLQYWSS